MRRIHEKPIYRGKLPQKWEGWVLGQFRDLMGEAWQERGAGDFEMSGLEGEGFIPQCTL